MVGRKRHDTTPCVNMVVKGDIENLYRICHNFEKRAMKFLQGRDISFIPRYCAHVCLMGSPYSWMLSQCPVSPLTIGDDEGTLDHTGDGAAEPRQEHPAVDSYTEGVNGK